ncbi:hypothetical protein BCT59_17360 [Vibrio breoganii]|nr:hypothetical protein BCT59_17360 [Vibrio breoganii]
MLTKVTVETALNVKLDEHLGYEKHSKNPSSNSRDCYSAKSISEVPKDVPRDRESSFERKCNDPQRRIGHDIVSF